jgi:hypothetical protein
VLLWTKMTDRAAESMTFHHHAPTLPGCHQDVGVSVHFHKYLLFVNFVMNNQPPPSMTLHVRTASWRARGW